MAYNCGSKRKLVLRFPELMYGNGVESSEDIHISYIKIVGFWCVCDCLCLCLRLWFCLFPNVRYCSFFSCFSCLSCSRLAWLFSACCGDLDSLPTFRFVSPALSLYRCIIRPSLPRGRERNVIQFYFTPYQLSKSGRAGKFGDRTLWAASSDGDDGVAYECTMHPLKLHSVVPHRATSDFIDN